MKKKITREEVLNSIIAIFIDWNHKGIDENSTIEELHMDIQGVRWMYDWLCDEYSKVNMEYPGEEEIRKLNKGDTIGKLADVAMAHMKGR